MSSVSLGDVTVPLAAFLASFTVDYPHRRAKVTAV
jgi:hypothetical protein